MKPEQIDAIRERAANSMHGTPEQLQIVTDCIELLKHSDEMSDELETERMRLAACGVAAGSNTRASIDRDFKDLKPEYNSDSLIGVRDAVEREIKLREKVESLEANACDDVSNLVEELVKQVEDLKEKIKDLSRQAHKVHECPKCKGTWLSQDDGEKVCTCKPKPERSSDYDMRASGVDPCDLLI